MLSLIFDIETDDLKATKVWCIVAQDTDTGKLFRFAPHQLESGLELLQSADKLIGHNILGFDIPVIKKLLGVDLSSKKVVDTLVLSRLFNPSREGGHSLARWGYKLKYPKINFKEFTSYSPEMINYCARDVSLNLLVLNALKKEAKGFSKESVRLEHSVNLLMKQQELSGFCFDKPKAEKLLSQLYKRMYEAEGEVHKVFKPKWIDDKLVAPYVKKDGSLSKRGMTDKEYDQVFLEIILQKGVNGIEEEDFEVPKPKPFMRKKLQEFNLGSRKQIGEYLQDVGWKPKKFTPTGQPVVDEKILKKIKNIPEAQLIAEYLLLQKRVAQIESWVEAVEDDGRVHGFVIPNGTITGRMAHRKPNMAQVPSIKSPYGKECRECWNTPKGYKLIGIDASGLELRMLAHYMKDEDFTNEIINGDIHSYNQKIARLQSRDQAKTFIYALIYGAANKRLGAVVGGSESDGKRIREYFFADQPAFKRLRNRVTKAATKGYVKGLDGRRILIRKVHSSLNSLLQGGGAIAMKRALIILNKEANARNLDFKFVANIHDEWQIEVHESHAEYIGRLGVEAIKEAGKYYNMKCPLDAEYNIGDNWSETH